MSSFYSNKNKKYSEGKYDESRNVPIKNTAKNVAVVVKLDKQ